MLPASHSHRRVKDVGHEERSTQGDVGLHQVQHLPSPKHVVCQDGTTLALLQLGPISYLAVGAYGASAVVEQLGHVVVAAELPEAGL